MSRSADSVPRQHPRAVSRGEGLALVVLSIAGHALLAFKLATARAAEPPRPVQQVEIEMVAPPPIQPPIVPPQAAEPERPRPVRRVAAPRPAPAAPPPQTPPSDLPPPPVDEAAPVPEGEENLPALAGAAAGPPAPPAPPAPPTPIVQAHEGANYLKNPRPAYPAVAMRQGWQGEVLVRVRVNPDGRAASVAVQRSSGRELLDRAALEAVKGWLFVPARQGGEPVAGWVSVPIVFRLQ